MPEPTEPLALEATALRYAARTLTPDEATAFESRLAGDQLAREALAEAVRLSAAALGQESPSPDRSFRSLVRDRLRPGWLARRVYRGHPFAWAAAGATAVAAAALIAVQLSDAPPAPAENATATLPHEAPPVALFPAPAKHDEPLAADHPIADEDMRRTAEIWAELSTPDHVEKSHDDEAKLQERLKNLRPNSAFDSREP